ncbi:hypothetical protein NDK50_25130 [Paraburkholderia bryophila]|uniref:hypothetical protein n=1 Tax=Paraburkholderia bryophila TaxID=420952 RepID=UPI00234A4F8B|nr:hypothetical protein [Paraburkholderia bryophila]WCM24118.1 hypothetical protein NDK50_25130 [Paraburkholderia bryophila]
MAQREKPYNPVLFALAIRHNTLQTQVFRCGPMNLFKRRDRRNLSAAAAAKISGIKRMKPG